MNKRNIYRILFLYIEIFDDKTTRYLTIDIYIHICIRIIEHNHIEHHVVLFTMRIDAEGCSIYKLFIIIIK